jgi:hypothetical protein
MSRRRGDDAKAAGGGLRNGLRNPILPSISRH